MGWNGKIISGIEADLLEALGTPSNLVRVAVSPLGREPPIALQHERVRYAFKAVIGQDFIEGLSWQRTLPTSAPPRFAMAGFFVPDPRKNRGSLLTMCLIPAC